MFNFTLYDIFTDDEILAGILETKLDKASLCDRTEKPEVYQILEVNFRQLADVKHIVNKYPENFEVRKYPGGDYTFKNNRWQGNLMARTFRNLRFWLADFI